MQVPWRRSDIFKKPNTGPIYLTPEGYALLKGELQELKRILPARIAEAARTAAYGDRSDNAEYKQAKGALRWTNYRILEIEDRLKRVSIIASPKRGGDVVGLGSTVVLSFSTGPEKTFRILGPDEANPLEGAISFRSPLGTALMGKKKGDSVSVQTPKGEAQYRILEVK